MRESLRVSLFVLIIFGVSNSVFAQQVVGWVENVKIYPGALMVKAKVDSGAKTSSLHCVDCKTPFMRDGKQWLSFTIKNRQGQSIHLERPIVRVAHIRRHFGKTQERYVIRLGICLGSLYREAEVTLVDRSGFNYSMLIGRNFLKHGFLINPAKKLINSPSCPGAPG